MYSSKFLKDNAINWVPPKLRVHGFLAGSAIQRNGSGEYPWKSSPSNFFFSTLPPSPPPQLTHTSKVCFGYKTISIIPWPALESIRFLCYKEKIWMLFKGSSSMVQIATVLSWFILIFGCATDVITIVRSSHKNSGLAFIFSKFYPAHLCPCRRDIPLIFLLSIIFLTHFKVFKHSPSWEKS